MIWTNYGIVAVIFLTCLVALYVTDRGLWNVIDAIALRLHMMAKRGRMRQAQHTANMTRAWDQAREEALS